MSTARSWTERLPRPLAELSGSWTDLRALLSFRGGSLEPRQRRRLRIAGLVLLALTLTSVVAPAYATRILDGKRAGSLVGVLPSFYVAFMGLAIVSAIASGGGREVIPREQAVAFPVSTWTEHFGALLLAPLNIAWLLQSWTLLGATGYVLGPPHLWASALVVLVWIVLSTMVGQLVGWLVEGVRRGVHGRLVYRSMTTVLVVVAGWLVAADLVAPALDNSRAVEIFLIAANGTAGDWTGWGLGLLELLAAGLVALFAGGLAARWTLHLPQREESRLDSGSHRPRAHPNSDLLAMVRVDRAGVWRSVPLRRGIIVLALMPGLVAAAGRLHWDMITILPGLVASGAGLLFGVNAWCLDGRGALWRDSLPVDQRLVFAAKAWVLFELLFAAAAVTTVIAGVRAGLPTSAELAATLAATVVVSAAVVSGALRWSVARPFAVDLRSARATPAPPVVMVGYSTRLALTTTMIGLLFSGLAFAPDWRYPVVVALPMVALSAYRLRRTSARWCDPVIRSRVVATVAS